MKADGLIKSNSKFHTVEPKDNPKYWIRMGNSLVREGKTDKAEEYYKKAMDLDPDNIEAIIDIAIVFMNQDKSDDALRYLKYATDVSPEYVEGWANRGAVLRTLERYEEAVPCYEKAVKLRPDIVSIWWDKAYLHSLF